MTMYIHTLNWLYVQFCLLFRWTASNDPTRRRTSYSVNYRHKNTNKSNISLRCIHIHHYFLPPPLINSKYKRVRRRNQIQKDRRAMTSKGVLINHVCSVCTCSFNILDRQNILRWRLWTQYRGRERVLQALPITAV